MKWSRAPWGLLALALACFIVYAIATRQSPMITSYGYSYSRQGTHSINGVAGLRAMYELRGWETRTLKRLSNAANRLDTIVWFPDSDQVPRSHATNWLDQWLGERPRTLVFIARGFATSESMYWDKALADADPDQRLEYRRRQAQARIDRAAPMTGNKPVAYSNGWFTLELTPRYFDAKDWTGPWALDADALPKQMTTRGTVRAYEPGVDSDLSTGVLHVDAVEDPIVSIKLTPLLESGTGDIVAARVQSGRWPGSQVLVLSSAECLLNLPLSEPINRSFADLLIEETGAPGKVGFLRTDFQGARVQGDSDDDLAAGMELLTQWPLSMTTMHVVVLGMVAILVLLPIFGRPRRLPPPVTGDFGEHVTAVADLLQRGRNPTDARKRISDYFVQVRGEDSGPWVLPTASVSNDEQQGDAS